MDPRTCRGERNLPGCAIEPLMAHGRHGADAPRSTSKSYTVGTPCCVVMLSHLGQWS